MATKRFIKPYMVKSTDNLGGLTHTLLDGWGGGKIRIPEEKHSDFLVAYATDIKNNIPLFVNELRGMHYRMFLDLDIMHDTLLTDFEIEEIMLQVYECFKRFFPAESQKINKDQFMCIVSDACPKSICVDNRSLESLLKNANKLDEIVDSTLPEDEAVSVHDLINLKEREWDFTYDTIFKLPDGRLFRNTARVDGKLKHGIHAVFPHIIVTSDKDKGAEALFMREALVDALTLRFGNKYAPYGWSQVVDNAVYVNSGLRMIYSCKTKPCDVCKGKGRSKDCDFCENGKDLSEGRPYVLKFACLNGVIDPKITQIFKENTIRLLSYATLYTSQCKVSDNWKRYNGCPSFGDIIETKSNGAPKLASKERMFIEEKKTTRAWKNKVKVTDPRILAMCTRHIQTRFVKEYKNIRIRQIVRDDKKYYISVDGEGSNFCLNLNPSRDHKSNRIWFSIEADGIRVRCFCSCMTTEGRFLGMCKDFRTPAKALNTHDLAMLFPQKQTNANPMFTNPSPFLLSLQNEIEHPSKKTKH